MCEDFAQTRVTKELAIASRQRTLSHFLFQQGILDRQQPDRRPPSILLFSVSSSEDKLKIRHFKTTELIKVESQAVLNTLTEHDFQEAFKNARIAGSGPYARKEITSRVMMACRPKVIF
jgi:hypothetical protein